jgi:ATP-dependent DNA helicase RecG
LNDSQKRSLETPVRYVKGVGEARALLLERMDVRSVSDLLLTLPHRYEDRRHFSKIKELESGRLQTVSGTVKACGWAAPRYGKGFFEAVLSDGTGLLQARWYGARYMQDQIHQGDHLVLFGKVRHRKGNVVLQHPEVEVFKEEDEDNLHVGRIVPVYPLTDQLSQRVMRRIQWNAVQSYTGHVHDVLPAETRERWQLPEIKEALREVHFPASLEGARQARFRLVFEEFLCVQLVLVARKLYAEQHLPGTVHEPEGILKKTFLGVLPFELTGAQQRIIAEIEEDMRKPHPMHRLLQGDVGSGKTVVAACAMLNAIECGSQAAVMAPTEVLAAQHLRTLTNFLAQMDVRLGFLSSALDQKERRDMRAAIAAGEVDLVIGTHALIQEGVDYKKLGMVVIDEQHKFGVEQRGVLYDKGWHPDVLVMTATPIPRTLAMTVYGDLDVSILDEMPANRQEIVTRVIREDQMEDAYGFIRKQVVKGRQAFLVYPLVSESDKMELKSAEEMFKLLTETVFREERVALLHGQMRAEQKDQVMEAFREGETDILVATTVVEVGVDVPNANIMLVENAERFGLAQLHQLRGRIGRGAHKSYCILQGDPHSVDSWKRLKIMQETTDGFRIAEEDLRIRGMGNLLGREQSGFPALKVGDPLGDSEILQAARQEAYTIIRKDPKLQDPAFNALRQHARELYKAVGSYVKVG